MPKSIYTKEYDIFRCMIVEARKRAGITQQALARAVNRPQSFISKCERGERRLDAVEFLQIAKALNLNVSEFMRELEDRIGD